MHIWRGMVSFPNTELMGLPGSALVAMCPCFNNLQTCQAVASKPFILLPEGKCLESISLTGGCTIVAMIRWAEIQWLFSNLGLLVHPTCDKV